MKCFVILLSIVFSVSLFAYTDFGEVQDTGVKTAIEGMRAYIVHYQNWMYYTINVDTPGYIETGVYNTKSTTSGQIEIRPFYRWRAGPIIETGRPLDFYIDASSRGFFVVKMPTSFAYTRDGRFILDSKNRLVTMSGQFPVMGQNGEIFLTDPEDVSVSRAGMIYQGDEPIDRLKIAVFKKRSEMTMDNMESLNGSFFVLTKELEILEDPRHYVVKQGVLEQNNVLKAITGDILMAKNAYDATVKTAHLLNKSIGTAASLASP